MSRIADYFIIRQDRVTLEFGKDIDWDLDFTLESGAHLGSKPILMFMVYVPKNVSSIEFDIQINGSSKRTYTFGASLLRGMHEVIDENVLKAGNNNIKFHLTGGQGSLQFASVALLYQRDI